MDVETDIIKICFLPSSYTQDSVCWGRGEELHIACLWSRGKSRVRVPVPICGRGWVPEGSEPQCSGLGQGCVAGRFSALLISHNM